MINNRQTSMVRIQLRACWGHVSRIAGFAFAIAFLCALATVTIAAESPVRLGNNGRLEYQNGDRGDRIPDFSYCGYQNANVALPYVAAQIRVAPSGADDTKRIQAAIDYVSRQPVDANGLRGAVLLGSGEFQVSGQLRITASGVVLRGKGAGADGTVIRATGQSRRALIRVLGQSRDKDAVGGRRVAIVDDYVPVGETKLRLASTDGLVSGQAIEIVHPSSKAWISKLKIDRLGWRERTRDISWLRTIASVDGDSIEIDIPLTLAIDKDLSQAYLKAVDGREDTHDVGIEDISFVSDYDHQNPRDEEHAWYGIQMQNVRDGWVQRVSFKHFAGGAIMLGERTSRITAVDCASFAPVSELGGYRRQTFFTMGQQCLFLHCWSEFGMHDFSVGHCAAGPNAFVDCYAKNALGDSGPRESCANGVLYDNVRVESNDLNLMNRWNSPPKAGWCSINSLLWQCQAANVRCDDPIVGSNWAIGLWATPHGNGYFEGLSDFVKPISLYQQQLAERIGDEPASRVGPFLLNPVGATNPSVEQAQRLAAASNVPARQLIDEIKGRWETRTDAGDSAPEIAEIVIEQQTVTDFASTAQLKIQSGWLTMNGQLLTGNHFTPTWWRGELHPERAAEMGPAITRFAPGRDGVGLTDDLAVTAEFMATRNFASYDHHYGLWYDRRRDDHLMVRRIDGEVIPPFYEQPFARSGTGTASDGLSKYDVRRFNPWYWDRLKAFAAFGEQNRHAFVLFHQSYFQHNILEAGAHWADSPWRPANNINDVELQEPPPYVGDKRIFIAEQFYDVSKPKLRHLHRNYIRQCLNNFVGQRNVIQLTSEEYSGPLSFVQFWIDTIVEWENETGNEAAIALSCTKDVQDAILADPIRSTHIDVIDIRYWTYTADGTLYAPAGGQNLAPRQHLRRLKPKSTSFESIVRSVREYRDKFPDKAITYNAHIHCRAKREGWAILMGGGSLPNVPQLPDEVASAIIQMKPSDRLKLGEQQLCLAEDDRQYLIYSNSNTGQHVNLPAGQKWKCFRVSPKSGETVETNQPVDGVIQVDGGQSVLWIKPAS
ncbi:MAG: hypothetical protein KDB27_08565 [Planctomycetales bacterium]|nr:hypothetical protein [Planctomycetales bacterium]